MANNNGNAIERATTKLDSVSLRQIPSLHFTLDLLLACFLHDMERL